MSKDGAGEFDLIARFFAPLAGEASGAFSLKDDAAVLETNAETVVTTDMMVEGVHFLPDSEPEQVARKLLRVNVSDLAAMGAKPRHYVLALALPRTMDDAARVHWVERFAGGLAVDQAEFGIILVGGDTVATPGPLTVSVTAFGAAPESGVVRRTGLCAGDEIWVSGTIGDAALGLAALTGSLDDIEADDVAVLVARHRLPTPRCVLGQALAGVATAMADVSDGLLQDLAHLVEGANLDAVIDRDAVPVSPAARAVLDRAPDRWTDILIGGDDYELVFGLPAGMDTRMDALAAATATPVTRIGTVRKGSGRVTVLGPDGADMTPTRLGFAHF